MTKSKIPPKAEKIFILVVLLLVSAPVFAQSVDTAWVRRYHGLADYNNRAYAITVDGSGNIYVTGTSYGSGTNYDYATIKYGPNGNQFWVRRYNGPGNGSDEANAIAVDDSGNVYVTGGSYGSGTNYDYATIKYYSNGDTAWVRRYNGPGSGSDYAEAIAVDGSGNVYVTGGNGFADYATVKYDQNGNELWVRTYNGPGGYDDAAFAIAVDGSDNAYITGYSRSSATSSDYATIKYDPNGNELWVRRYNRLGGSFDRAWAIAVNGFGNVYVTGTSELVKHDTETVDSLGNVYVPGTSGTIKYDTDGNELWIGLWGGVAIAIDDSGNVYVTGVSGTYPNYDYATIRYYPNDDTAWVRRYNGPVNDYDNARAIAVDGFGNVYVTGTSVGSATSYDYATIRYYPNGDTAWVRRYNGPGNDYDDARAIAVDGSGNVYVTGWSGGGGALPDYATIKYVQFLCGDVNKDGVVNSADLVYLINYLFVGGPAPIPILHVGDVNQDEAVNGADIVYLINYLYIEGSAPCQ